VLSLALTIARRITRRVVELDRGAVEGPLEAALELIAQGTRAVVSVHPDDEAAAREALPGLMSRLDAARDALLEADESVTRGSCVVRTPGGSVIDADLETQIDRIVSALRPGGAAP
jgi:flagellar assembly protein FliH